MRNVAVCGYALSGNIGRGGFHVTGAKLLCYTVAVHIYWSIRTFEDLELSTDLKHLKTV